jgi:CubicO group peptidase (beta-lactamase class C family)
VISKAWVNESTRPLLTQGYAGYYPEWFTSLPGQAYYQYMWWGAAREGSYYPDQRKISLENTHIIDPPGQYFLYNKYHPQLLGMILERATGMSVTNYLQTRIWDPLGMEFGGSWSTDSEAFDFEKMETGVNARAIDFAKFGVSYF